MSKPFEPLDRAEFRKTDSESSAFTERRTMQFVVERCCPVIVKIGIADLPQAVWIFPEPITVTHCGHEGYLVDTSQRTSNGIFVEGIDNYRAAVCKPMGYLCE